MNSEWLGFALVAAAVTVVCSAVMLFAARRRRAEEARLAALASDDESQPEMVLGNLTVPLAGTPGERDRSQILPELLKAGFYRPSALTEFVAVRTALVVLPLLAAGVAGVLLPPDRFPLIALVGLVVAALGFSLPRVYINSLARRRAAEVERGLPVFADLMSLALMAGQSLQAAQKRVAAQMRTTFPMLAEELDIVRKQSDLLSLPAAFDQWAARSQHPDVQNLAAILGQTQKVGNDVTTVLLDYAASLRTGMRQRADAMASRAAFWMLFPTVLCLWIPAGVILVGPIFYEFGQKRQQSREALSTFADPASIQRSLRANQTAQDRLRPPAESAVPFNQN